MISKMKGWKTVAFNAIATLVPVLGFILENPHLMAAVTGPAAPTYIAAVGLINIVLRAVTDTAVGKKE